MELYETIKNRYSCRSFTNQDVPEEVLTRILDAARLAPSASNRQRTRVIAVRDPETRAKLGEIACGQSFVGTAPVVLVFCAEGDNAHVMTCGERSSPIDAAIFIDHVTLLATAEGLATCWIGAFKSDETKKLLGIPEEVEVVELLPLGYPAGSPPASRSRLPLAEILHRERW